jgi:flagellar basal-body rod protein FlgG
MNVSLYEAAAGMNASTRWQDIISQNLTSSSIPGSRKQHVSFSAVEAGLTNPINGSVTNKYVMPTTKTTSSFTQGELRPTGLSTDVAIEGTGMLEVLLPDNTHAYTRNGELNMNAQGQLVTRQGYKVLTEAGSPITLNPQNPTPIHISTDGQVSQGVEVRGRIGLVDFNKPDLLKSIGNSCYVASDPAIKPTKAINSTLVQGCLEAANSSPTLEMSNLITAMRMFESNQKAMSLQDERMGKTISDLGSPS